MKAQQLFFPESAVLQEYSPSAPYVFKTGKHKGQTLEVLMFKDYAFLVWLLRKLDKDNKHKKTKKNMLHLHLEWLLKRGEDRIAKMLCPQCSEEPVVYFSVIRTGSDCLISHIYTSCEKEECIEKLYSMSLGNVVYLYPFRFSVMMEFSSRNREQVTKLFKTVFDISRLTPQIAFDFFNNS